MLKKITGLCCAFWICINTMAGNVPPINDDSLDIKIGQMILIGIGDMKQPEDSSQVFKDIRSGKCGGIILFEKNIATEESKAKLTRLNTALQTAGNHNLWISIDEEGGKVHRLKKKYGFIAMPSAKELGETNHPDSTQVAYGRLAALLKETGINLNFAPVLDMAINKDNKVVYKNNRCFSDSADKVAIHAIACVKAHRESGVMTVLKHFPGHGSSTEDSHLGITDISSTWKFNEILPYQSLISQGYADAVMTGHLVNLNLDTLPSTLSEAFVRILLRGVLCFKGPVFSDDMQMNAIASYYGKDKAIELAINAGVDVLVFGNNLGKPGDKIVNASEIHGLIKQLVLDGKVSRKRIDEAYRRITLAKNYLK